MLKSFITNIYVRYTFSFLLLLPMIFLPFLIEGRSFVWDLDGISQHYPSLVYYGKLLKEIFTGQVFPFVDFELGLGFDTITTLHYYVLGDPIAFLAILMTKNNEVFIYGALILLRLYLAGGSYIAFLKYWRRDGLGVVLGALIYVFSGYALFAGVRHPFFLNPMIYLPLLLIGLEQVLRKQRPYLLIVMVFIIAISNFYFFYILTIIAVIYVIFRYFYQYRKNCSNIISGLFVTGFRAGSFYLIGVGMAAVVFLPVVYAFVQNGRLGSKPKLLSGYLLYDTDYYLSIFQGIFASGVSGYWSVLSFSSIVVVGLVLIFSSKRYRQLRIVLLLSFGALSIPAFGCFMNGFSYITNRWVFLIGLLISVIFAITYEKLFKLSKKEMISLIILLIVYEIIALLIPSINTVKYEFLLLLITVAVVLLLQIAWFQVRRYLQKIILYVLVIATLGFHGYLFYSPQFFGYVDEFLSEKKVQQYSTKGVLSLIPKIDDDSFYRVETYGDKVLNEALTVGYHDVSGYFSLMDGSVTENYKDMELNGQRTAFRLDHMDNRTILDSLLSVKYFVTNDKNTSPYGYQLIKVAKKGARSYYLFQNKFALPIGFAYDSYMLRDDYDKLSVLEKQNAQMYAVILEQENSNMKQTSKNMASGIEQLEVKISTDDQVDLGKESITVKQAGGTITLEFNSEPDYETYLRFENLTIDRKEKVKQSFSIIEENSTTKSVNVRNQYYDSYFGKENYLINLGCNEEGKTKVRITFPEEETYHYDNLSVYRVNMKSYEEQVTARNKAALRNVVHENNEIQGDISIDKNMLLYYSIPYSKGWSALIDGEKVDIFRANIMYMALPLEPGDHHIVLKYETPLYREGCILTLLASLIFIVIVVVDKRKNRNQVHCLDDK